MADLLPSTPDLSAAEEADPRVVGVDSEDADDLISALSAGTARELLAALHDEPANPAALAERADTSLQNAQYHLSKLENAGIVEVIDTVYSEKGREMNVYAPSDRPLVVYAGKEEETTGLKTALSRLLGSLSILGLASVVIERLFGQTTTGTFLIGSDDGIAAPGDDESDSAYAGTEPPEDPVAESPLEEATPSPADATEAPAEPTDTPPGPTETPAPEATSTPTAVPDATEPPSTEMPTEEPAGTEMPPPTEVEEVATETPIGTAVEFTQDVGPIVVDATAGVPPGLLFFAGGATVLVVGFLWYYRAELLAGLQSVRSTQ